MTIELTILVAFILSLLGSIAFSMYHSVHRMLSSPEARENSSAAAQLIASVPHGFQSLLELEGFRFTKAYSFHASTFGIWIRINAELPLRMFYVSRQATGVVCEFITEMSDEVSLTTTSTRSAFVFPRPFGSFLQSFPKLQPDELWKAHLRGEDYVVSQLAIPLQGSRLPFLEGFKRGVIRNLPYVTSMRMWFVRGVYWYSVKRFLLHNRPIWQQNLSKMYGKSAT